MALKDGDVLKWYLKGVQNSAEIRKKEIAEFKKWKKKKLPQGIKYKKKKYPEVENWKEVKLAACETNARKGMCRVFAFMVYGLKYALERVKNAIAVAYVWTIFSIGYAKNWLADAFRMGWLLGVFIVCVILLWVWKPLRPAHKEQIAATSTTQPQHLIDN
ncbi:MAG: hypothetical protein H7645_06200 [Candidatus Heimdallarchaeota archaeon]|nr:hypothetical protein [Candidatus Heimdallarchaeota archaeon]MCK4769914.1 hypothetical protein [Candidatus Heimdallarchaeota archaeon]